MRFIWVFLVFLVSTQYDHVDSGITAFSQPEEEYYDDPGNGKGGGGGGKPNGKQTTNPQPAPTTTKSKLPPTTTKAKPPPTTTKAKPPTTTTKAKPPATTTKANPPVTTTTIPPTTTTKPKPPPTTSTTAQPPTKSTSAPPSTTSTTAPPPTTSTTALPPASSTTALPPTTSITAPPPTTSTTAPPPTTSTTALPPTSSTTALPPSYSSTALPPTTSTTDPPFKAFLTAPPPTTSTTALPPTTSTTAPPPTTSTTSPTPTTSTTAPPPTTSTTAPPPTTSATAPPQTTSTTALPPTTSTIDSPLEAFLTAPPPSTPTAAQTTKTTSQPTTSTSTTITTTTEKPDDTSLRHKKELYELKLTDYDPRIRPIQNQSQPIYVNTKFVPLSLIDFDTTLQRVSIMAYIRIGWIDHNINWKPRFYSYTTSMRVPSRQIWTPKLILQKSVDGQGVFGAAETDRIYVSYRGHVQWVPEATYSVVCNVNVRLYPFDEQTCTLTYYVPGATMDTLDLDHYQNVDMSEYVENPAWIIVGVSRTRYIRDKNYNIDIEFRMRRRADFTTFTLVAPLMMLAFLNICVFLIPSNSGEKGSFSITIFLAYSVYISMMSDTLPHNSVEVSLFVVFIIVLLCLSVVSVFYTIIQAKMASAFGNKECPLNLFRRAADRNKVVPVDPAGNPENTCMYTWEKFFEQLDTFLFGSFLVTITMVTGIFFAILLRNVTFDDPDLNLEPEATTRSMPSVTTAVA